MPFVVDTSIAVCWLMPDEVHPVAQASFARLDGDEAIVPALWWFEVRNVLVVNERRGRLDAAKSDSALELLRALPITMEHVPDEVGVLALARRYRLTVYDASYLELAQRRGVPLATLDTALASAAKTEGVEVWS